MSTYYYALNSNGDYIFDNFPEELKKLVFDYKSSQEVFDVVIDNEKKSARLGKKNNDYGTIYTLTTESKYINRYKLFSELINMSSIALKPLSKFQNNIIETHNARTEEFIHNLTSLNSYNIQDLFTLIPQTVLAENINKQHEIVKAIITEKPNVAVKTLLKLIKNNLAMKVEFSVFERTQLPHSVAQKIDYSIRTIILSILQIFIDDFEKKNIEVSLDAYEKRLNVDYDSLLVSFFYLFDNAVKYCCPKTKFKIIFKEENNSFSILFNMISIKIKTNEVDKLCHRGYRSHLAKSINKEGSGIGMYRILKTLKINDAELEISPRINNYHKIINDIEYEGNQFKIKFIGQQDWFKINLS
jgi:K+-sensing histidine kinase KdpD